jgi:hypothetical protein
MKPRKHPPTAGCKRPGPLVFTRPIEGTAPDCVHGSSGSLDFAQRCIFYAHEHMEDALLEFEKSRLDLER